MGGIPVKTPSQKKKVDRRRSGGCCKCVCKCLVFTILVALLLTTFAFCYLYSWLNNVVDDFTVDTPKRFPVVEMSDTELDKVLDRVDSFFDSIVDGETHINDLVLKEDEINGFIGHSDFLRGNLMVTLHQDLIVESFSLPMDKLGLGKRYFVGSDYLELKDKGEYGNDGGSLLEMKVETEAKHEDWFDGPLMFLQLQYLIKKSKEDAGQTIMGLFLEKGSFFGQAASDEFINERVNLLQFLYEPENAEALEEILEAVNSIERVSIEEGKLVVKAQHK